MGQRHQIFVIAKANGRYRTLAAFHQQWSYGASAVERCRFVLQVICANAVFLRQEVQKAETLDWAKEVEAEGVKVSISTKIEEASTDLLSRSGRWTLFFPSPQHA